MQKYPSPRFLSLLAVWSLAVCAGTAPALAQTSSTSDAGAASIAVPQTSPSDELAALEAQIPILEAKAKIAKLNADIKDPSGMAQGPQGIGLPGLPALGGAILPVSAQAVAAQRPIDSVVHALSISAFDGQYRALLAVDGQNVTVRQGDEIQGGWTVQSITDAGVKLIKGKQVRVVRL